MLVQMYTQTQDRYSSEFNRFVMPTGVVIAWHSLFFRFLQYDPSIQAKSVP